MRPPRIYLDSSIWSFAVADDVPDYREATEEFFDHVRTYAWEILISQIVFNEIERASDQKRGQMKELIQSISPKRVRTTEAGLFLAREYIRAGVLSERHRNDCLHVALATVAECDFLLSWNFRHLANIRRAAQFLAVNTLHGYNHELVICNPLEVYEI